MALLYFPGFCLEGTIFCFFKTKPRVSKSGTFKATSGDKFKFERWIQIKFKCWIDLQLDCWHIPTYLNMLTEEDELLGPTERLSDPAANEPV